MMSWQRFTPRWIFLLLIFLGSFQLAACTQRMPRPQQAQRVLKSYFKDYGKKYPESDFGRYKVETVEVSQIDELQYELVLVTAYLSLGESDVVYKLAATLLKKTLFWKLVSWESLGRAG